MYIIATKATCCETAVFGDTLVHMRNICCPDREMWILMAIHVDVDCNCTPRFSSAENNVDTSGAQCAMLALPLMASSNQQKWKLGNVPWPSSLDLVFGCDFVCYMTHDHRYQPVSKVALAQDHMLYTLTHDHRYQQCAQGHVGIRSYAIYLNSWS
jgi:hypothetical protein